MINNLLSGSVYFGMALSLFMYWIGVRLRDRLKIAWLTPLFTSMLFIILFLTSFQIDFEVYNAGAQYITYLLTPVTVALAVPMYKQLQILKKNWAAIFVSLLAGVFACAVTIFVLGKLFHIGPLIYHSLQTKSVTTAVAIGISEEIGGNATITVFGVTATGLFGAATVKGFCRLFRITHPVAVGLSCGNSAHAVGTTKAMEIGELEGAMSSLAIVVAAVMTSVIAPVMAGLL